MTPPMRRHLKRAKASYFEVRLPYLVAAPQYATGKRRNGVFVAENCFGLAALLNEGMTYIKQIPKN